MPLPQSDCRPADDDLAYFSLRPQIWADELIIADGSTSGPDRAQALRIIDLFYMFWATGDDNLPEEALSPGFIDRTSSSGRSGGREGIALAGEQLRHAPPDLSLGFIKIMLTDRHVTVHLDFTGHFTGTFRRVKGRCQLVHFVITDVIRIEEGRIAELWRVEDSLALYDQMGMLPRTGIADALRVLFSQNLPRTL
jgi:predicted ester cyclase